ncbi:hypothetical protein N9U05_00025 [bacterium]|nr:hypothetical protein [bacterium]
MSDAVDAVVVETYDGLWEHFIWLLAVNVMLWVISLPLGKTW